MTAEPDLDEDLVAFVHGELEPARARALRARLDGDPDLAARVRVLASADAALREALDTPRAVMTPIRTWRPSLLAAAAAVLVVALVFASRREADPAFAQNDLLAVSIQPRGGASHPVLTELAFDLQWTPRGRAKSVHVLPLAPLEPWTSPQSMPTEDFAKLPHEKRQHAVPVVVTAVLKTPDGETRNATLDARSGAFVAEAKGSLQTILSHDLGLTGGEPAPFVFGRPREGGFEADFVWAFANAAMDQPARWFPDQPGVWTLEFRVHSAPPTEDVGEGAWLAFEEPLVVTTRIDLTGVRSEWGEAQGDMRARLVVATGCSGSVPFALQLRYTGKNPREYNVSGPTITPIPQPLHFELLCDRGAEEIPLAQRAGLGVVTGPDAMPAHVPNTTRTILASLDYWTAKSIEWNTSGRSAKFAQPGDRLAVEFVSQLTTWTGDGSQYWQGRVRTGFVELPK